MTGRRAVLLAFLLAAACVSAWGQVTISPATLPVGGGVFTVGQAIPQQNLVTNFPNDPNSWTITSGNFPPGLTLDIEGGFITGTPTVGGVFTFTVTVQDFEISQTGSRQYTLYISLGPLTLSPVTHPPAAAGAAYTGPTFQGGGGVPGYTWSLQGGPSVNGLAINTISGQLSGTPLTGGVFTIGVTLRDASGAQVSGNFNLNVLGIVTVSLPNGVVGTAYSQNLTAAGGSGTLGWSISGTPPPGITLSPQGQLTGTPTTTGVYPFVVQVTDASTQLSSSKTFSISVSTLAITTTSLAPGNVGTAYSQTLAATGSTNPLTWSLSGTAPLPPGLNISAQGVISGTPTQAGGFSFQVQVTDSVASQSAVQALNILIIPTLSISPSTLPNGVVNIPYPTTTLAAQGLTTPTWRVAVGTLPAGLNLDASTGIISGTPTAVGSSTFTISASGGGGTLSASVQRFYTVVISSPSVTISGLPGTSLPAQQTAASVLLSGGPYPSDITGTMTLSFAPASGGSQTYDAKFGIGSPTTAAFTIPAGSSQGVFNGAPAIPVMTGTVAGTITITTVLQNSTLPPPAPTVITVSPTAPVISKVIFASANGAFSISVTGYSTPRDMTSVLFQFTPTTSAPLTTTDFTIPLTSVFTTWYNSSASTAFGSQFTMTVPFSFSHPPGTTFPCLGVSVTLTNSKGSSVPSGTSCQAVLPAIP